MSSHNSVNSDSVVNKALESMPRFAWAFMGIMFSIVIFLMFSGLDGAFTRVVNAYATRIERSVEQLEAFSTRVTTLEARITAAEKRIDPIETENRQYHRGLK
jgi:type II secretory pathway component PulJ